MSTSSELDRVVAPVVHSFDLELVDLEVRSGTLLVVVDQPGGLGLDLLAEVSQAVSVALDRAEAGPRGRYDLEVSSPGLERRLRLPAHFQAHLGALVSLRLRPSSGGDRRFEGRLVSADGTRVEIEAGSPSELRCFGYDEIERAHLVFDWRAALAGANASPGSDKRERRSATRSRRAEIPDRPSAAVQREAAAVEDRDEPGVHRPQIVDTSERQLTETA